MKGIIVAALFAALFVSGCAAGKINLRETGEILVDIRQVEAVHTEEADVYAAEGGILVSGIVRRHRKSVPSSGTVEITVVDPGGSVLAVDEAEYVITRRTVFMPKNRTLSRTGPEEGRFRKQLHVVPPPGSTVRLTIKTAVPR